MKDETQANVKLGHQGSELVLDLPGADRVKEGDTPVLTDAGVKRSYLITRVVPSDDGHTVSIFADARPSLP